MYIRFLARTLLVFLFLAVSVQVSRNNLHTSVQEVLFPAGTGTVESPQFARPFAR